LRSGRTSASSPSRSARICADTGGYAHAAPVRVLECRRAFRLRCFLLVCSTYPSRHCDSAGTPVPFPPPCHPPAPLPTHRLLALVVVARRSHAREDDDEERHALDSLKSLSPLRVVQVPSPFARPKKGPIWPPSLSMNSRAPKKKAEEEGSHLAIGSSPTPCRSLALLPLLATLSLLSSVPALVCPFRGRLCDLTRPPSSSPARGPAEDAPREMVKVSASRPPPPSIGQLPECIRPPHAPAPPKPSFLCHRFCPIGRF
jgi:hypothetical protein